MFKKVDNMKIQSGHATHVGRVRDHNEDSFCVVPEKGLWLIADGMGGYQGGEIASAIVAEEVPRLMEQGMAMKQAIGEVHTRIKESVKEGRGHRGMGSTVVAIQLNGTNYDICWVGDSRAYLWDNSSLEQVTRDHSLVQALLDSGTITEAEALVHPQRNVISQALGSEGIEHVRVDCVSGTLLREERILLCSDGLTSEVTDEEITSILATGESCQSLVEKLILRANENGGGDNITVMLVEAPEDAPERTVRGGTKPMPVVEGPKVMRRWYQSNKTWFLLFSILLLFISLLAWGLFRKDEPVEVTGGSTRLPLPSEAETKEAKVEVTYEPMEKAAVPGVAVMNETSLDKSDVQSSDPEKNREAQENFNGSLTRVGDELQTDVSVVENSFLFKAPADKSHEVILKPSPEESTITLDNSVDSYNGISSDTKNEEHDAGKATEQNRGNE